MRRAVRLFARAPVRRVPGAMNKTEARYAEILEARKRLGEIAGYWFEGITLRLADDVRYTPDFLVQVANGELEVHEVKGFLRDDARIKFQVAARAFPFRVVLVKSERGHFHISEVAP